MNSGQNDGVSKTWRLQRILLAALGVWGVFALVPLLLTALGQIIPIVGAEQTAVAGTIGDSFGMANSFFSCLALGLVAYTLLLQREDLGLQRKANEMQFEEFQTATEAAQRQAEQMERAARIDALSLLYSHHQAIADDKPGHVSVRLSLHRGAAAGYLVEIERALASDSGLEISSGDLHAEMASLHENLQAMVNNPQLLKEKNPVLQAIEPATKLAIQRRVGSPRLHACLIRVANLVSRVPDLEVRQLHNPPWTQQFLQAAKELCECCDSTDSDGKQDDSADAERPEGET